MAKDVHGLHGLTRIISRDLPSDRQGNAKNAKKTLCLKSNLASIFAPLRLCVISFTIILFSSCFGVNMDIALNQNGSGIITLEYRINRSIDALGRLDGNQRWNTIPVGRADFERTLDRLPEMRLLSFSSREDERDLVINARLEFASIEGLLAFLDAGGRRSVFSGDARSGRLLLTLNEGAAIENPALRELIAAISEPYSVNINMSFPGGRRTSYSFPLNEVLNSAEAINLEFSW